VRNVLLRLTLVLVLVAAAVAVNVPASRYNVLFVQPPQRAALEPLTVKTLDAMDVAVHVTSFLEAGHDYSSRQLFAMVGELLDEFEAAMREKLSAEIVIPSLHGEQLDMVAARTGLSKNELAGNVLFECEQRMILVTGRQIARFGYDENGPQVYFAGENAFLHAILAATGELEKRAYFTEGLGEASHLEPGVYGVSQLAAMLESLNITVGRLALAGTIPDDCDMLIIAGPTEHMSEGARANLQTYIAKGGAVLILTGPGSANAQAFSSALEPLGVKLTGEKLLEAPGYTGAGDNSIILCTTFAEDPVTAALEQAGVTCGLRNATPVGVSEETGAWLLASSPGASLTTEGAASGEAVTTACGVVPLAVLAGKEPHAKAVVVGSAEFATNACLDRFGANAEFLRNACLWLLGKREFVPEQMEDPPVIVISKRMARAMLYLIFITPAALLVLGLIANLARRRGPQ